MKRDEALELLPLLAGDDLESDVALAVREAVSEDAEAAAALADYEELESMLQRTLSAPAEEPTWLDDVDALADAVADEDDQDEQSAPIVRRRCPFCRDALGEHPVVFCAECATPHHDACFGENAGCSLLGCGATRSVATQASASRPCGECERLTPQDAPFCAWCGAQLEEALPPRHERAGKVLKLDPRPPLARFAAAASLLLVAGLGLGGLFGRQQATTLTTMGDSVRAMADRQTDREARDLLELIARLQERFFEEDLDGDGLLDHARSLAELDAAIGRLSGEAREGYFDLRLGLVNDRFEVRVGAASKAPGKRWWAVAVPRGEGSLRNAYFVGQDGTTGEPEVERFDPRQPWSIDPEACRLTPGKDPR